MQDSLGCTPLATDKQVNGTAINIGQRTQISNPKADKSNAATSIGSITSGEAYTEASSAKRSLRKVDVSDEPESQTEFQKFVEASIGAKLNVFGEDLFTSRPASFDPLLDAPAPSETIVGPNEELRIRVWGQVNFAANLRVSRAGEIYLPKIGAVHVAGLPFGSVTEHLQKAMDGVYRNYEITVDLGEIHSIQIYITGLARHPGAYTVSGLSTLVDAIFLSGGPSGHGSMRHLEVKRSGRVVADYDLYALIISGDKTGDIQLQPGDVLYFPVTGPQVALAGSARQPGIFELRGTQTIQQLIDMAGGTNTVASNAKLSLERIAQHSSRTMLAIEQDSTGLGTPLQDGDIVRIDPIVSIYKQAVTLRGSVANPGRFSWHQGMHLSEVIPDRDSLMKRDYWWERTKLGAPIPEQLDDSLDKRSFTVAPVNSPRNLTNWNYAVIERMDRETMKNKLIPFNLGRLVLEHNSAQDLQLEPGDVITIFSQNEVHIPIKEQTKYFRLEGEVVHPGVYSIEPGDTLRSVVAAAGGFTQQAYVYGAVFSRESTREEEQRQLDEVADRLEQQATRDAAIDASGLNFSAAPRELETVRALIAEVRRRRATGRVVLALDRIANGLYEVPDMQLEDGDSLFVPHTPDTVQVIGAVFNPHAFLLHPGGVAADYLKLAGGATRDADHKHIYVLRADGAVANHDNAPLLFKDGLKDLVMNPGDAVVVPQKSIRTAHFSSTLQLMQMLSQPTMASAVALRR